MKIKWKDFARGVNDNPRKIRFYPVILSIKFVSGLSWLGVRETFGRDVSKADSEKENMING